MIENMLCINIILNCDIFLACTAPEPERQHFTAYILHFVPIPTSTLTRPRPIKLYTYTLKCHACDDDVTFARITRHVIANVIKKHVETMTAAPPPPVLCHICFIYQNSIYMHYIYTYICLGFSDYLMFVIVVVNRIYPRVCSRICGGVHVIIWFLCWSCWWGIHALFN